MKRFIIFIICLVCFSPHTYAKIHTVEADSQPISTEQAENYQQKNPSNDMLYDVQEKLAYKNAQQAVSEKLGIVVESLSKTKNMAYDTEIIITTTASVQRVLEKNFRITGEGLVCHLKVEVDDAILMKALDKAKEVAQKEYYHALSNINEQEAEEYKKQSINPTSIKDSDVENLYKLATQAYNQELYGNCVQYCQQILLYTNGETSQMHSKQVIHLRALEYLSLSYAHMNKTNEAIATANELLITNPKDICALYAKQMAYYYSKQHDLSIATGYEIFQNSASELSNDVRKFGLRNEYMPQYTYKNMFQSLNILAMALADSGRFEEGIFLTDFETNQCFSISSNNILAGIYWFKHSAMNEGIYYKNSVMPNYYVLYMLSLEADDKYYKEIHNKINKLDILTKTNNKALSYYLKGLNYHVSFQDTENYFKEAYLLALQHPADIIYIDIRKRIVQQILNYRKKRKDIFNDLSYMTDDDKKGV